MPQETAAGAPWGPRLRRALGHAPFLAVVLPALWAGLAATRDLGWPYDPDFFRSIAQAQVFADGQWTAEPFYRGEKAWYPPLAQAVVAVAAKATGAPVPLLFARLGPWLNLLGPLALYGLALRAFGRDVALLAVFDYVYLRPAWLLSWASGSYSPWLFSTTFAHGFFLGALALYLQALASGRAASYALAGCAAGLTFLCHNSPAVLLGVVVGALLVDRLVARATPPRGLIAGHAVLALAAALTALPNLLVLVGHYGLRFQNPVPARWVWQALRHASDLPRLFSPSALLGLAGLAFVALRRRERVEARLLLAWVAASGLALTLLRSLPLLPPHHMLGYFQIALSLGLGLLGAELLRRAGAWPAEAGPWRHAAVTLVALAAVAVAWPTYVGRRDLAQAGAQAEALSQRPNQLPAYEWLRAHTRPSDVVLASDELGFQVAGPSGRGVVAVPSLWASPFVDDRRRHADRDRMLAALDAGDDAAFCALARAYGVTHLLRARRDEPRAASPERLRLRFESGSLRVYEVAGCPLG